MARIFISYSRVDETFARRLADSLERMSADVWIDVDDIAAGRKWSDAIQDGLDNTDALLVLISPPAMDSRNVEDEWQYMLDNGKPVIPLLLREAKIHFQLNRIQWVDFLNQDYTSALRQLRRELRRNGIRVDAPPAETEPVQTIDPTTAPQNHPRTLASQTPADDIDERTVDDIAPVPSVSSTADDDNAMRVGTLMQSQRSVPTKQKQKPKTEERSWLIPIAAAGSIGVIVLMIAAALLLNRGSDTNGSLAIVATEDQQSRRELTQTAQITQAQEATRRVEQTTIAQTRIAAMSQSTHTALPSPTATAIDLQVTRNDEWTPITRTINGVEMVLVPAGEFRMGPDAAQVQQNLAACPFGDGTCQELLTDERDGRTITIDTPFWIDVTEATDANGMPIVNVDWVEATNKCEARGTYLPSEEQWEYAAKGPDNLRFPWGDTWQNQPPTSNICDSACTEGWRDANYTDGYAQLAPAGEFPAGASWVGALDMAGNVWEYTSTSVDDSRASSYGNRSNILRGGAWTWIIAEATTTSRSRFAGNNPRTSYYGFRCARDYQAGDLER